MALKASSISEIVDYYSTFDIRLDNISVKASSSAPILNNISLDILKGEIIAVLGPSGAGKSTLLRTMAG